MGRIGLWLRDRLRRETAALPVDVFRALVGLISAAYFLSRLQQARDFGAPDGLIDHALLARALWYTRLSLFQPGVSLPFICAALGAAALCSVAVALGYRAKPCAAVALVVAASWSRWTFLIIEIDDAAVQLMLLWLLLLPVGTTLTLAERLRDGPACWRRWAAARVPGAAAWCLLANVRLIYLVAGLWKLASPMWRDGFALYAVLRLPMSRTRDLWSSAQLPCLRAAGYAALVMELSLPFLLSAPRGSLAKRLGLLCQLGFHLGILALFGLPFVSLLLSGSAVLFFGESWMERVFGARAPVARERSVRREGVLAAALLVLLAFSSLQDVPRLGSLAAPAEAALWVAGIAQNYRLFDWIAGKNFRLDNEIVRRGSPAGPAFDPETFLPSDMSGVLLQSYLYGVRWMAFPRGLRGELKDAILERAARRFCRLNPGVAARLRARAVIRRILPSDPDLTQAYAQPLIEFRCAAGEATIEKVLLP